MLCPECLKSEKRVKLKVQDSRPVGPHEQQRKYVCTECDFIKYNIERLDLDEGA